MGRISLPSISKIEEVLDVLLDPAKYQKYLVEFKAAYDEAANALGNLKTKEQADKYLSDAIDAKQEADVRDKKTQAHFAIVQKALADEHESIKQEHAEIAKLKSELGGRHHTLQVQADEIATKVASFEAYKKDTAASFDKTAKDLDVKQASIKKQSDELAAKLEKFAALR